MAVDHQNTKNPATKYLFQLAFSGIFKKQFDIFHKYDNLQTETYGPLFPPLTITKDWVARWEEFKSQKIYLVASSFPPHMTLYLLKRLNLLMAADGILSKNIGVSPNT